MDTGQTLEGLKMFTGGALQTNSYLVACPEGNILIDAPEGSAEAFRDIPIAMLLLTHGHYDHVWDAAAVARHHGCTVAMHPVTETMLADRNLLRRFGIDLEVEPVNADLKLLEGSGQRLLGRSFNLFEVPGHCPGSLCIHDASSNLLFGGDVLFAGGVGRWDLPGGDRDLLLSGISTKLLPLPGQTIVLPGHGPSTTIAEEKANNPYLARA
ncbi:MAG: MBL fold metallo-hydrolase [Verrucomicrobia bacterium]|nr:MBL fold metallo-hydrolase [Verrucomicrobiota bacterium]